MSVPGEHCSSGCKSKDHTSYAECMRAKDVGHMHLGGTHPSRTEQKRWSRENEMYRQARRQGLQPAGVSERAVNRAYEKAEGS